MKLLRTLFISLMVIATLAAVPFCLAGDVRKQTQIQILEIRVSQKIASQHRLPLGWPRGTGGTKVSMAIASADQYILRMFDAESAVRLVDDKGTVLVNISNKATKAGKACGSLFSLRPVAGDINLFAFYVTSEKLPNPQAKKLILTGLASVELGLDEKQEVQHNVVMEHDTEITAGPASFLIKEYENRYNDQSRHLELFTDQPCGNIKRIAFFDSAGKEIESSQGYTSQCVNSSGTTTTLSYTLSRPVKKVTVKVSYFKKTKKIKIPLAKTFSIGLGDK